MSIECPLVGGTCGFRVLLALVRARSSLTEKYRETNAVIKSSEPPLMSPKCNDPSRLVDAGALDPESCRKYRV